MAQMPYLVHSSPIHFQSLAEEKRYNIRIIQNHHSIYYIIQSFKSLNQIQEKEKKKGHKKVGG